MRLQDKVCLVTGGAAGIGRATAERFAEEGATVILCDLNEEQGRATAAAIGGHFYKVNVADRQAVGAWVDEVVAQYGRVDVLVNNAGVLRDSTLVKVKDGELVKQMSEADFDLVIAVNLKGVFNCTQAVVPHMIRQGGGVILNASSIVGLDGNFGQTNYVATKAAVIGMTKVWARELGRAGIRVNAIAPGFTAVSYTHLDVYKRQRRCWLEGHRSAQRRPRPPPSDAPQRRRTPGRRTRPERVGDQPVPYGDACCWLGGGAGGRGS